MNAQGKRPVDYDLTCWYLNQRRVLDLVGSESILTRLGGRTGRGGDDQLQRLATLSALKDALVEWLRATNPPTLGQLLVKDKFAPDMIFTLYSNLFCRGLPKVRAALDKQKAIVPAAEAYGKLDDFRPGWSVSFRFHHEHLTSNSAWFELSGQKPLFVLGAATALDGNTIKAIPWVIANPIPDYERPATLVGGHWRNRLEVFPDAIEAFSKMRDAPTSSTKLDLQQLRAVPEREVKKAFAEIIGEPVVPKDWGGERSDLFTSRTVIEGKRVSAAFAFKGPAEFKPLTNAGLGKNGDQIDRLFTEPAELLVLQHCHEITPAVRGTMRAYAQRMGDLRLFCLIDGYDTIRLFRAYNKCGFRL